MSPTRIGELVEVEISAAQSSTSFALEHDRPGGGVGRRDIGNFQRDQLARFIRHAEDGDELVIVVNEDGGIDARRGTAARARSVRRCGH